MIGRLSISLLAVFATCACSPGNDEPVVWGDVDPRFSQALSAYESWDKSCTPGDTAQAEAIAGGVILLKVDAMLCQHMQLSNAGKDPLSEPLAREEHAKLTAAIYGMTGDGKWLTTEYCDTPRDVRLGWMLDTLKTPYFAAHQPTTQSSDVGLKFGDHVDKFFECDGDYDVNRILGID